MPTPIEVKLRNAALATPALTALLGSSPFRWGDTQHVQNDPFPSVEAFQVSAVRPYVFYGRNPLCQYRVQINIWGCFFESGADAANTVRNAILTFLDTFSAVSNTAAYPNRIVNERRALYPQTDGAVYQRMLDVMIWSDDTL